MRLCGKITSIHNLEANSTLLSFFQNCIGIHRNYYNYSEYRNLCSLILSTKTFDRVILKELSLFFSIISHKNTNLVLIDCIRFLFEKHQRNSTEISSLYYSIVNGMKYIECHECLGVIMDIINENSLNNNNRNNKNWVICVGIELIIHYFQTQNHQFRDLDIQNLFILCDILLVDINRDAYFVLTLKLLECIPILCLLIRSS